MGTTVNVMQVYIADTIAAVLAILLLTNKSWRNGLIKQEKRYFELLIFFTLASCLFDAFNFGLDGQDLTSFGRFVFVFSNYWMFLGNIVIGPLWVGLVITHTTSQPLNKFQKILDIVLCSAGAIILFTNLFVPIVFEIDENNVYHRGDFYLLFTIIQAVFMLDGLIVYYMSRKKNKNLKHFPVFNFLVPFIVGVIIQFLFYGVSTMMVFLVVSICGIVFGITNENEVQAEALRDRQKNLLIIADQKIQLEQQQTALEEAVHMANAANAAKTSFLNNMSHDIRTPMNAIIGYTGLAKTHMDNKKQVEDYLGKIEHSSTHLLSLINDVLDMSRIESGKMKLCDSNENIVEIVNVLGDIVQADVKKKDLKLTIDVANASEKLVVCDKLRLNQILLNILSNSIKYTPNGGDILFKVSEEIKDDMGTFTFVIKDNGMGMSPEFLKTIFEPFARVNSSTVSGIQGTGLGMAITKKFIDLMNGKIDIESEEGKGTQTTLTFEFKLAVEVEEAKAVEEVVYDFNGKRLLLVEDNELNREIACEILSEDGFIVATAEDGSIAVEMLAKAEIGDYDLVLMDVQMPVMNGYEATKAIRMLENKYIANIPIVAMTANAFEEDRKDALLAGMNDYISKPIDIPKMKKVLAKFLK